MYTLHVKPLRPVLILVLASCLISSSAFSAADPATQDAKVSRVDFSDLAGLADFASNQDLHDTLERHCASSSDWKYARPSHYLIAQLRPAVVEDLLISHKGSSALIRIWFGTTNLPLDPSRTRVKAGDANREILCTLGTDKMLHSDVLIVAGGKDDNSLRVQIIETGPTTDRPCTVELLKRLGKELKDIKQHQKEIDANGYTKNLTPPKSIAKIDGKPSIAAAQTPGGGIVVSGYINESEKGYITVHFMDAATKEEINTANTFRTVEYVGWSADKSTGFYWETTTELDGDGSDKSVEVPGAFSSRHVARHFHQESDTNDLGPIAPL